MVIQALGIILVLAVVMSVAAVGSSTSGRTDPERGHLCGKTKINYSSIVAACAGGGKSVPHRPQSFRCSGGFPFLF